MDARTVLVVGDDTTSHQLRAMLASHNINVLGAGLAVGLPLDMLTGMCIPLDRAKAPTPAPLTEGDQYAMAAADAKRERRAAKRKARAAQLDGGQGEGQ
jgi:hypothetical protein